MQRTTKTYSHRQFLKEYSAYRNATHRSIDDLDLDEREFFVTWCRKCGSHTVTRLNIRHSVFWKKGKEPLCFHCQPKRRNDI